MHETGRQTVHCIRESAFSIYLIFMRAADNIEIQIYVALVNDSKAFEQGDFTC